MAEQTGDAKGQKVRAITDSSYASRRRRALQMANLRAPKRTSQARSDAAVEVHERRGHTIKKRKGRLTVKQAKKAREKQQLALLLRQDMQQRLAADIGEHAANIVLTTLVLSQGAITAAHYLVDLVSGRFPEASHAVRMEAAKAVIDRAVTLRNLEGTANSQPMNNWSFEQLRQFVEQNDRTVVIPTQSDNLSDAEPLLTDTCETPKQLIQDDTSQPATASTTAKDAEPAQAPDPAGTPRSRA